MPKQINRRNRKTTNPLAVKKEIKKPRIGLNFNRRRQRVQFDDYKHKVIYGIALVAVVVLAYVLVSLFGIRTSVVGRSMESTLYDGDIVVLNKLGTTLFSPSSGTMVAFLPGGNEDATPSVKRVIGVPGDRVRIENGAIYVNDKLYEEGTTTAYITEAGLAANEIQLKDDEFFVLGDNRNNSQDSRYESVGNIHKKDMLGQVWFKMALGKGRED